MNRWDQRFMALARHVGEWSKDRSRKVGCVVVAPDSTFRVVGYNGFPRGLNDDLDKRHARPTKYSWTEHAERNAIYAAARAGIPLVGCKMYLSWFPCADCARGIIQAGIVEVIAVRPDLTDPQWGQDFELSIELFKEAGLFLRYES